MESLGLVKCGVCDGPVTVMGKERIGCAHHHSRSICINNLTVLHDKLQSQVLDGLKLRLLAPEPVEHFVKIYVQEVNAANQERGARRTKLHSEQARITRQIKTVLDTIEDVGGSRSLVDDLRSLERRQDGSLPSLRANPNLNNSSNSIPTFLNFTAAGSRHLKWHYRNRRGHPLPPRRCGV